MLRSAQETVSKEEAE
jgi:hypothetical protein